jgi:hypothetical protein
MSSEHFAWLMVNLDTVLNSILLLGISMVLVGGTVIAG